MTKNDFLYILSDAIQQHEGWKQSDSAQGTVTFSRSVINNNPGNIKYVGQDGVKPGADNFCVAPNFLIGKALQIHDLSLKMDRHYNIRSIIELYAPPYENNTEAYIAAVVAYFHRRNIRVTDVMPIQDILRLPIEMALIVINGLAAPAKWHSVQTSIDLCAAQMPEWGFTTRYADRPILDSEFYINASPSGNLYAVREDVTRGIVQTFNEGQKLNCLFYEVIKQGEAGGVQYGGEAVSFSQPATAFCNVLFQGVAFAEPDSRTLFHELVHCIFTLVGSFDLLHTYLIGHGGYQQNLLVDLRQVYYDIMAKYKSGVKVVQIATQAISVVKADSAPADQPIIVQLLIGLGNLLASWLGQR